MFKNDLSLAKVVAFSTDMDDIEDSTSEVKTSKFSILHSTQDDVETSTIWNIVVNIGKFALNFTNFRMQ